MRTLYPVLLLALLTSCGAKDKIVEKKAEDLIMQAIVTGQWKVTSFQVDAQDITADFSPYKFQFKSDYTVDAFNYGTLEKTGTWNAQGNAQAQTMTAYFANGTYPLMMLNGVWDILSTTWTSVNARQVVNGATWNLRLEKL